MSIEAYLPIVYLFLFIGFGALAQLLAGGRGWFHAGVNWLSRILYYILIPIVFYDVFSVRGVGVADLGVLGVSTIYVLVSVGSLIMLLKERPAYEWKGITITATFMNAIFLGFPVIMIIYGDLVPAAMYSLILSVYHLFTAGLLAESRGLAGKLANMPILYGFLTGTLIHYTMPTWWIIMQHHYLEPTHPILSYSAVFVLGATIPLSASSVTGRLGDIILVGAWRFIVSPLIHYLTLLAIPLPGIYSSEILVLSMMPPAVMNTVLARIYGWEPDVIASATMIHTLIGIAIIAGIIML